MLHVGISNSKGEVYNFDERGCNKEKWKESLAIKLEDKIIEKPQHFDKLLDNFNKSEKEREKKHKYTALDNNCYSYVVRFLNSIEYQGKSNHTKESLIEQSVSK